MWTVYDGYDQFDSNLPKAEHSPFMILLFVSVSVITSMLDPEGQGEWLGGEHLRYTSFRMRSLMICAENLLLVHSSILQKQQQVRAGLWSVNVVLCSLAKTISAGPGPA